MNVRLRHVAASNHVRVRHDLYGNPWPSRREMTMTSDLCHPTLVASNYAHARHDSHVQNVRNHHDATSALDRRRLSNSHVFRLESYVQISHQRTWLVPVLVNAPLTHVAAALQRQRLGALRHHAVPG